MPTGVMPLCALHYMVTLLDTGVPRLFEVRAKPDGDGWCVLVEPADGTPPFDFFVPLPGGTFLKFLNKLVATAAD